jgi:hypothetical protein
MIHRRSPASSSFVLAAARLRALQLDPPARRREPAAARKIQKKSQAPARRYQAKATGLIPYALLTSMALMGAAYSADGIALMTDPVLHYVHDEDTAAAVESRVVDGSSSDGSAHIAIDRADVDLRVASADLSADGLVSDRIVGSARGKHDAELRAARYLVDRLNQLSDGEWASAELVLADARNERGVDCIARKPSGDELLIQVSGLG